jgi:hypothetical protein
MERESLPAVDCEVVKNLTGRFADQFLVGAMYMDATFAWVANREVGNHELCSSFKATFNPYLLMKRLNLLKASTNSPTSHSSAWSLRRTV